MPAALKPWPGIWRAAWSRREACGGALFPAFVLLVGALTVAAPYFVSNNIAATYLATVWDPECSLDRSFPVVNWMIAPYAAFYLLFPATLAAAPRDDRGRMELVLGLQALSWTTWACVAVFLLLPAEVDLRGQLTTHWVDTPPNDFEQLLFALVHDSDAPWNAWPSLHIVHSYMLVRLMTRWALRSRRHRVRAMLGLALIWSEWSMLCVSVLATKQHYLFDLLTGAVVAHVAWVVFARALKRLDEQDIGALARDAGWVTPRR